jgi:hypothetical protein
VVKKNTMFPYRMIVRELGLNVPTLVTRVQAIQNIGLIDSNYYQLRSGTDTSLHYLTTYYPGYTSGSETASSFAAMTATYGPEVNSINVPGSGTLFYNASGKPAAVDFPGLIKTDVKAASYSNGLSLAPWTSIVLFPGGSTAPVPVTNDRFYSPYNFKN